MEKVEVIDTNIDNIHEYGICGYKNLKREGYPEKIEWLKDRFQEGLRIKTLYSPKDGTQGMIEYIPGEYCWRPVEARSFMFIHCIFVGFRNEYKGKGFGSLMLKECMRDSKKENMHGIAVVTRKGSFMADKNIFMKKGFEVVDNVLPDFELLALKWNTKAATPKFKLNSKQLSSKYRKGLTIIRANQCPYTVKNVKEICATAEKSYNIKPKVINLNTCRDAQNSPCPFGTFCIVYNGKIIAHHPISNTRFTNIMNKIL
ncbi:acetyltransferase [bacterium SM23_57]|nr:MAG: acetyltransferase [bacterium SM23_57]